MNTNDCNHRYKDGRPAVAFIKNRWRGVMPKKVDGICKLCNKQFSMSYKEYKDFMREEEYNETNF